MSPRHASSILPGKNRVINRLSLISWAATNCWLAVANPQNWRVPTKTSILEMAKAEPPCTAITCTSAYLPLWNLRLDSSDGPNRTSWIDFSIYWSFLKLLISVSNSYSLLTSVTLGMICENRNAGLNEVFLRIDFNNDLNLIGPSSAEGIKR